MTAARYRGVEWSDFICPDPSRLLEALKLAPVSPQHMGSKLLWPLRTSADNIPTSYYSSRVTAPYRWYFFDSLFGTQMPFNVSMPGYWVEVAEEAIVRAESILRCFRSTKMPQGKAPTPITTRDITS